MPQSDTKVNITIDKQVNVEDQLSTLTTNVSKLKTSVVEILGQIKEIEKTIKKEKKYQLQQHNKKEVSTKRKPTGFAVPKNISDELCKFIDKPSGSEVARTDITSKLVEYVKKNNLENPNDKRIIIPDEKLKKLFNSSDDDEITYFNMQKFINHHFQ